MTDTGNLRHRAEATARENMVVTPCSGSSDELRLVHELQVHQIELELQNTELRQARDEAEALRADYADLYDFAPVGYVTLDLDGVIRRINHRGAYLLGLERSRVCGTEFVKFLVGLHRSNFTVFLGKVWASRVKEQCEMRLLTLGDPHDVLIEAEVPECGEECRLALVDITRRNQVEAALRENRMLLDKIINGTKDAIFVKDTRGRYLLFNAGAERITGKKASNVLGKDDHYLLSPAEAKEVLADDRSVITGGAVITCDETITDAAGQKLTFQVTKGPLFDEQGSFSGLFGFARDITEKQQTEETLRRTLDELEQRVATRTAELTETLATLQESNQRFSSIFHARLIAISLSRQETGEIIDVNQTFLDMFGFDLTEVIGRTSLDLGLVTVPGERARMMKVLNTQGQVQQYEVEYHHKSGRTGHLLAAVEPVELAGQRYLVEMLTDITARKQAETLLTSINEELERQVADRTAALTEANQSLSQEIEERKRVEQDILEQQERLQELAQELAMAEDRERDRIATELHDEVTQRLILAKMKVDQLSSMLATTALVTQAEVIGTLLEQSIQDTRLVTCQIRPPLLASSGLEGTIQWLGEELHEHYGLRVDLSIDREPIQLEYGIRATVFQAVRELLQNVVKHADTNQVRVRVTREGQWLEISVEDNGSGFDPATVSARKARSSGFGLFNIRQKIEYLGGNFLLKSRPGAGTRVTIRMPLATAEGEPEVSGKLKILLVDDQSFVREGLRALVALEQDMVVVAEAGTGRSAVVLAREHRPDVVVMDLSMPDLNGIDATRVITEELAGVKVLAFSVEADRCFVVDVLKAGASGYVLKDSAFATLATAIRTVAAGETYLGPRISEVIIREYLQRVPAHNTSNILTEREREILQMIAAGQSTKEIAFTLEVSIKTIDLQRHNIMNKLNLYSIAELTKYAIRTGLTTLT